ncbi:ECF-type sigma factor [Thalassoglobus sp. JC818]|uniref:ECF-type sigma factor n=1 Tax=Thalassoglobus sp. JC818 TaxID=3232136 RepID=UPI0034593ACF
MTSNSVTLWLRAIEQKDEDGAQQLFNRYFERLVTLARKRLHGATRRVVDEEDIAIMALYDCLANVRDAKFPQIKDRQHLWRLLVTITECRVHDATRRQTTTKRGSGRVRGESVFVSNGDEKQSNGLAEIPDQMPTSDDLTALSEEFQSLLAELQDDNLREVAKLVMAGYSTAEIAEKLDRTQRTIQRRVEMIREIWVEYDQQIERDQDS